LRETSDKGGTDTFLHCEFFSSENWAILSPGDGEKEEEEVYERM
jgi:hypothetical protein